MTNKIRVACYGAGYFSQFHYDAWKRIENVELVASANRDIEKALATGLPAYSNLKEMLVEQKPDLLDIITPPLTHLSAIKTAIQNGVKTIICQKPFCLNISEAEQAIELAKIAKVTLVVHENFRFQPWYRKIKQVIENHEIGQIQQITFRLRTGDGQGPNAYLDRQPYFQTMPRLLVHETAVHWVDVFQYLLGPIKSVYADLRILNPVISGEDAAYIIFDFGSGVRALFDGNRHLDHSAKNHRMTLGEALVEGTGGSLNLYGDGTVTQRKFGETSTSLLLSKTEYNGFAGDCVFELQNHVIRGISSSEPIENTATAYLSVLKVEKAIYESAEQARKLEL